jgi:Mg2+ and Co2+ transporter CorA
VGVLVHRLVDDVADTYLDLLDAIYSDIDTLEDRIDTLRRRTSASPRRARHMLLHRRRNRLGDAGGRSPRARRTRRGRRAPAVPAEVERLFGDTYDTLVRVTEEPTSPGICSSGVRDHLQSKIAENQNESGRS